MTMKRKTLDILAGCPAGATELALANNGITRACLDRLVRAGHVRHAVDVLARPKGMTVDRFHITAAGAAAAGKDTK